MAEEKRYLVISVTRLKVIGSFVRSNRDIVLDRCQKSSSYRHVMVDVDGNICLWDDQEK